MGNKYVMFDYANRNRKPKARKRSVEDAIIATLAIAAICFLAFVVGHIDMANVWCSSSVMACES